MPHKKPHKRVGVADLGTNTFHLVVREFWNEKEWVTLAKDRQFVHLGETGVGEIGPAAFDRGIHALKDFAYALKSFRARDYKIIGTAALRRAKNRDEFVKAAKEASGLDIEIISGDKEGSYIYQGVRQSLDIENRCVLVMDIGGGSVEFIIGRGRDILWVESLPLGSSLTYNRFHRSEPISPKEQQEYRNYINQQLAGFYKEAAGHQIDCLIGASGSYDTLVEIECGQAQRPVRYPSNQLDLQKLLHQTKSLASMNLEERMEVPGMSQKRAALMVVATILIEEVIHKLDIKEVYQSEFALKEGVLLQLYKKAFSRDLQGK